MERKPLVRELRKRYQSASKGEKGEILEEYCLLTGQNRVYAARLLRTRPPAKKERGRKKPGKYQEVLEPLRKIWATLDNVCGKRMAPAMPEMVARLSRDKEIVISSEQRELLHGVSAATIDRLLAGARKKQELRGRSMTKPGTILKHQVAIRTFADWNNAAPGFIEIDLVGHEGGNPRGDFCQTLDATDIATTWTETRAVKNKAQLHVFAGLKEIESVLPFPLLGIDSDNGSEFINAHLIRHCRDEGVTFTRGRPQRKNDGCYVEQKNYSVVRRNVGYARYDTKEELKVLNELYRVLRLHTNYFMPSQKLIEKVRIGSKVTKRYDTAKTPYQRVLDSEKLTEDAREKLRRQYDKLNPAELMRRLVRLRMKLMKMTAEKERSRRKEATATENLGYISPEAID